MDGDEKGFNIWNKQMRITTRSSKEQGNFNPKENAEMKMLAEQY
jgi:hypothetical protein